MKSTVIDWDGSNLPPELRDLPPGCYVIEPIEDLTALSEEEEAGIIAALDELNAGGGTPLADALREIRSGSSRR